MKKLLTILALAIPLLTTTVVAATPEQTTKALDVFFAKYSGKKGYTTMELTSELLKAAYNSPSNDSNKELGEMLEGVERMRIVIAEKSSAEFTVDVLDLPGKTDLKLVTNVNENGQKIKMYYKPAVTASKGGKQNAEFLMFILSVKDNITIHITGDFDLKNVTKLGDLSIKSK